MHICIGLVMPRGGRCCVSSRSICFCRYQCPGFPTLLKNTCLDLLLISCDNILKKKDVNVHGKLASFYFPEKDRKFVFIAKSSLKLSFSEKFSIIYFTFSKFWLIDRLKCYG